MNYKPLLILLIPIFFGCTKLHPKEERLQSLIDATFHENPNAIGIMIHVEAPDQNISWSGAVGYSVWDKTVAIDAEQPGLIASITKNYVAVSILRLIEQGKIDLSDPLSKVLSKKTSGLMVANGFDLNEITIAHLLSHKSGIPGHTGSEVWKEKTTTNPMYRWTRDEQIRLGVIRGKKDAAGIRYNYTDTNYLFLTEIIEQLTGKVFYKAIKELIGYEKHGLKATWFHTLEKTPKNVKPLVHQYVPEVGDDSYEIDNSIDLYGGGGLATTTHDLAKYGQLLFENKIFDQKETLELLFTDVKAKEGDPIEFYIDDIPCEGYLGISECEVNGFNSYLHGGYWGTIFRYFPDLNATVVLYVINGDEFANLELGIMTEITNILK